MNFITLHPVADHPANAMAFDGPVLGVEVTVPALAARCSLGNIDPQHAGGNAELAAIEAALDWTLPSADATLATVRADLDSVGAMAVLMLRVEHDRVLDWYSAIASRVVAVANADKFARGEWARQTELPRRENPWPVNAAGASDTRELAAMAAAVADFKIPLAQRVEWMKVWLLTGQEPSGYRAQVEREREGMIAALESGEINYRIEGGLAVVESTHRAATMVGYAMAPVVIAINPAFRFGAGEPHRKITVCQFKPGYVDLKRAAEALGEGWGGSPTIIGSPQGLHAENTLASVIAALKPRSPSVCGGCGCTYPGSPDHDEYCISSGNDWS